MKRGALAAALMLAACSDEPVGDPDGGVAVDASIDAPPCVAPREAPSWLGEELTSAMAALTGATDIAPGVRLTDRASATARGQVRDFLAARVSGYGLTARLDDYGTGANVMVELPGSAGAPWVVIGAHFDSVRDTPGADDNASGTAAVLAVARMLAERPCRTRGVMVVWFDQEEAGLLGSSYLAGNLARAGTPIHAVHTLDQVGYDSDRDRRFEVEQPTPSILADYQAAATDLGVTVVEAPTGRTDHVPFRDRGFPAAGLSEEYVGGDTTPHYHTPTDTTTTLDLAYLGLAARLAGLVVARQAGVPD